MILRGELGYSLGGFVCVRGYAPLGDLARASHSDKNFQRELIKDRKKDIERFLDQTEYLFFPEVILSFQLLRTNKKDNFSLKNIDTTKTFTSHNRKVRFRIRKLSFRGQVDIRIKEDVKIVEIEIDESLLKDVPEEKKPFFRIDGNHRLSAATIKPAFEQLSTPFCLLLFEEGANPINQFEKIIFHNMNSKSVPLTPEENLKVILNEVTIFPDDLLKKEPPFGWEYYFTRKLELLLDLKQLDGLQNIFKDHRHDTQVKSVLLHLFQVLVYRKLLKKNDAELKRVLNAIFRVNTAFSNYDVLKQCKSSGLFICFVFYELQKDEGDKSEIFLKWVLQNHLYEL